MASVFKSGRSQAFLRELLGSLDALPVKELGCESLKDFDGAYCAVGALIIARGLDTNSFTDGCCHSDAEALGAAQTALNLIVTENDKDPYPGSERLETNAERFVRMRAWVAKHIKEKAK